MCMFGASISFRGGEAGGTGGRINRTDRVRDLLMEARTVQEPDRITHKQCSVTF